MAIRPWAATGVVGRVCLFDRPIAEALRLRQADHNEISFTRREIGRLIGRKEWGGRDREQLARALHEIHLTFIRTHFKRPDGWHQEHSFNIFPEILIERREFASDPIEACTITLAEPIVANLYDGRSRSRLSFQKR
jgi:hypothetical protein